jgi:sulfate adenylyltransferase
VSPYRDTRAEVRRMVGADFIEVFVDTPLEVVEARDVKGWYAKARSGEVSDFTGISDPYEPPTDPELTLRTTDSTPEDNADLVLAYLEERGILGQA